MSLLFHALGVINCLLGTGQSASRERTTTRPLAIYRAAHKFRTQRPLFGMFERFADAAL